jgi:type II secretory pathway component PulC
MMKRHLAPGAALLAGFLLLPTAGQAQDQQQPPPTPPRRDTATAELRAEREVFAYPGFERRNPFKPLTSSEGGPRFEMMRLQGIIYSTEPGRSVALITAGGGTQMTATGTMNVRGEGARLRVGQRWGNVRVVEIRRDRIIVDVEEFGLSERREMVLNTRGQGGSR